MSKRFFLILASVVVGLGLIFWVSKDNGNSTDSSSNKVSSHLFGEGKSGVTLVEYGDFQCPFCGQRFPIVKQIKDNYKKQITFQFRNFPLPQHQNAFAAHRAAEAADKQGKFWQMHDLLYENQKVWSENSDAYSIFENLAKGLGLNIAQFKSDFASSEVNAIINADKKAGLALKVDSTPTFFLDSKNIGSGPVTYQDFAKLIDNAIKAKQ